MATAPAATACGMNAPPSALLPGTATNTEPGVTLRLSEARRDAVTPADGPPRASGKRSPIVAERPFMAAPPERARVRKGWSHAFRYGDRTRVFRLCRCASRSPFTRLIHPARIERIRASEEARDPLIASPRRRGAPSTGKAAPAGRNAAADRAAAPRARRSRPSPARSSRPRWRRLAFPAGPAARPGP